MDGSSGKEQKGFSGLVDLASDINEIVRAIENELSSESKTPPPIPKDSPHCEPKTAPISTHPPEQTGRGKSSGRSGWIWAIASLAVIIFIWLINTENQSTRPTSYRPPQVSQRDISQPSTPTPISTPFTIQSAELQYEKPPVGTNQVLTLPQIRWSVREAIRIDTMRNVIDTNEGITLFNKIVDDYNSRCGSFRYRQGDLERAQREVETYRNQIVSEAIRDAKQLVPSVQQPVTPTPTPYVYYQSATPRPQVSSSYSQSYDPRFETAQRLQKLGLNMENWQQYSLIQLMDFESRIEAASRLRTLGYEYDWRNYTLMQLMAYESRIGAAARIQQLGWSANWQQYTLMQLMDFESRIEAANRLAQRGYQVDWQQYTLMQLMEFENRAR